MLLVRGRKRKKVLQSSIKSMPNVKGLPVKIKKKYLHRSNMRHAVAKTPVYRWV